MKIKRFFFFNVLDTPEIRLRCVTLFFIFISSVELTADCSKRKVKVRQIGGNLTSIDDKALGKGEEAYMGTGSTLFVLEGI